MNQIQSYTYDGYWEDMGSMEAFYQANIESTRKKSSTFKSVSYKERWQYSPFHDPTNTLLALLAVSMKKLRLSFELQHLLPFTLDIWLIKNNDI